jgi:hypothetical protein
MDVGLAIVLGALIALWLLVRARPRKLRVKAAILRWVTFEIEMQDPAQARPGTTDRPTELTPDHSDRIAGSTLPTAPTHPPDC